METSSGYWIVENVDSSFNTYAKKNFIKKIRNSSGLWIIENNFSSVDTETNCIEGYSSNCFKLPVKVQSDDQVLGNDSSNDSFQEDLSAVEESQNFSKLITSSNCDENTTDDGLSITSSKKNFINMEVPSNSSQLSMEIKYNNNDSISDGGLNISSYNNSVERKELSNHLRSMIKNKNIVDQDQNIDDEDNSSMTNSKEDSTKIKSSSSFVEKITNSQSDCPSSDDNSSMAMSIKSLSKVDSSTDSFGLMNENEFYNQLSIDKLLTAIAEDNLTEVMKIINSFGLAHNPSWLNGYTALCTAIRNNCKEIAKFLLEKNPEINSTVEKLHNTPLHLAVIKNDHEIVEILLEKKADVNKKNLLDQSPLDVAITMNNKTILQLFVKYMSLTNVSEDNYIKLLFYLFDKDYVQLTENLLTKCPHIDLSIALQSSNLLCRAVDKEYYAIVENLLERGVDVNYSFSSYFGSQTALYIACEKGNYNLVKLLLSKGADVKIASQVFNYDTFLNYYPIRSAIEGGHFLIVKILLDYEIDINKCYGEFSPLHLACNFCQAQIVKLLIHNGANINIKNDLGISPISIAAKRGYTDIFKYLLENEDFHLDFDNAKLILEYATKNNFSKILMLFMSYINELDAKDNLRYEIDTKVINNSADFPLLHTAARFDSEDCIDILVQSGALVDLKDKNGKTPLHVAYQYGRQKFIISLLKNGSDINAICDKGYTPFEYLQASRLICSTSHTTNDNDYEERNVILNEYNFEEISSYFAKHIAMMKILNLYVNTKNYDALIEISDKTKKNLFQQQGEYEKEAKTMKTEVVVPSAATTYYNFVKANLSLSVQFLNNENILETLKTQDYNLIFPNYSTIINGCFQKALTRKNLLDETEKYTIFDSIQELPDPCIDKIINYFSNNDLRILINQNKFFDDSSK